MWYKQAEALMDMRKITNPAFRLVLVQCALPDALQFDGRTFEWSFLRADVSFAILRVDFLLIENVFEELEILTV
jgi:hypothetical protein